MKKIFILTFVIFLAVNQAFAMNFGMYKPEEDYGLLDGLKFNLGKKDRAEGKQLIQLKTTIPEEREKMEQEKAKYEASKEKKSDDEYQMFKFMLDDTVSF